MKRLPDGAFYDRELETMPWEQVQALTFERTRQQLERVYAVSPWYRRRFDEAGEAIGEWRFIGLFTSSAYSHSPRDIPLLRRKVRTAIERAGLTRHDQPGGRLMTAHLVLTAVELRDRLDTDVRGQCSEDGPQVEVPVRHMKGDDARR